MEVQKHESRIGLEKRGLASVAGERARVRIRGQEWVVRVQVLGEALRRGSWVLP